MQGPWQLTKIRSMLLERLTGARVGELHRRLGKIVASGLVAGLAIFHAALLWERILSFSLLDPAVAVRWGIVAVAFAFSIRTG